MEKKLYILYKFHQDICINLLEIADKYNCNYTRNNYVITFYYKNEQDLLFILNILNEHLSIDDKKILFVSTDYQSTLSTLNNLKSLYALIQSKLNHKIIDLITSGDLYSVMQPIYDLQNEGVYGYEFLLRGKVDEQHVSPLDIFETASEVGLQHLLDSRARELSIENASKLDNNDLKIFINFLPSSISHDTYNLSHTFLTALDYDIALSRLVFELVETEKLDNLSELHHRFNEYKTNGTSLALDDVGAGYSSLNKLHQLIPTYVKLDRGIVSACDTNFEKSRIIKSIVDLCNNLNIITLAEGIEREEELQTCINLGVNLGQGFLLGKPLPHPIKQSYFKKIIKNT